MTVLCVTDTDNRLTILTGVESWLNICRLKQSVCLFVCLVEDFKGWLILSIVYYVLDKFLGIFFLGGVQNCLGTSPALGEATSFLLLFQPDEGTSANFIMFDFNLPYFS